MGSKADEQFLPFVHLPVVVGPPASARFQAKFTVPRYAISMTPNLRQSSLRAIDFFCGAGGMSLGLRHAGIEVIAGIDIDSDCGQTFQSNIPGAEFIQADVSVLKPADLETQLGVHKDDDQLVMVGCSPCQHYSQIRTDRTKSTSTALLLNQFQRFVEYFRPGFVVIENVPRLAKVNVLAEFIKKLEECSYSTAAGILNAAYYGVPQNRLRYLLVASRNGEKASLPPPSGMPPLTVLQTIGPSNGFASIPAGHRDDSDFQHTTAALSENNLRRMSMTPPDGGQRDAWASHPTLQLDAYKNRDTMFRDSYGRMFWAKPAPTITTKFLSVSNGRFGHPSEARGISVREGATLQSFPRSFRFHSSSLRGLATQIGNAVPPELARHVGAHLLHLSTSNSKAATPAKIDGRKVRAKATFESVSAASRELMTQGLHRLRLLSWPSLEAQNSPY